MASLLPELESEVDAFKVTDPTVGQESAELAVPKMLGKYQTAIELQAIQAPDGKVNDHKKLLEIIRAGESSRPCPIYADPEQDPHFSRRISVLLPR